MIFIRGEGVWKKGWRFLEKTTRFLKKRRRFFGKTRVVFNERRHDPPEQQLRAAQKSVKNQTGVIGIQK